MTTELEQEFYNTFGIEKQNEIIYTDIFDKEISRERFKTYPNITAEKLLEMICIYNEFQNNCDKLFIPANISTLKEKFLTVVIEVIKDEISNRYFCNDVDRLKNKLKQLFNE